MKIMNQTIVLIPAYNPDTKLVEVVNNLSQRGIEKIVVVNDGSKKECSPVFQTLGKNDKVIILEHSINKGQGGSLKTGMDYINFHFPQAVGVVTADADGQHCVKDILRIRDQLLNNPDCFILGVRKFGKEVPSRSRFGNILTSMILRLLFGLRISDTQTGLRGIPGRLIPEFLKVTFNRFEFNTETLLVSRKMKVNILEVPIETIYIENNVSSHFNPVLDSMKIYFAIFRYILASLVTAIADYFVFILAYPFFNEILVSTYTARVFSLFVNYFLLKKMVFYSKEKIWETFPKYIILVFIAGFISASIIYYLNTFFEMNIVLSKIIAEGLLYFAIFIIQREFVFHAQKES